MLVKGQDERNLKRQKIVISFYTKQLEFNEYDEVFTFITTLWDSTGYNEKNVFPPPKNLKKEPCLLLIALMLIPPIKGDHYGSL